MQRLLFVDDNIRSLDGHYFELATLLMQGGEQLGYLPQLATHTDFVVAADLGARWHPAFTTQRMLSWSLGVDGRSRVRRDDLGRPKGGSWFQNGCQALRDRCCVPGRNPTRLLNHWADDLVALLQRLEMREHDTLVINTADDFLLLALARALDRFGDGAASDVHVIFHFAIYSGAEPTVRARQFGIQVNQALGAMQPRRVHLHATTEPLTHQLRSVGVEANPIPYPTRQRKPVPFVHQRPETRRRLLLAGLPRREKGTAAISKLLEAIDRPHLQSGRYQVSIQLPEKKWKRIVPASMHDDCHVSVATEAFEDPAVCGSDPSACESPIEIFTSTLTTQVYHQWLDTADVGLFLYNPERYVARCSGVLLEMLVRGVPVIVPDHCWLADQVREAGGDGSIGYIYQSIEELPQRLHELAAGYESMRRECQHFARLIAERHHPTSTLRSMGIRSVAQAIAAA